VFEWGYSLFHGVNQESALADLGVGLPREVELFLGGGTIFLFFDGLLIIASLFGLLGVDTLKAVAVGELPGALATGLVVFEFALEVDAVGVDPAALADFSVLPLAEHFHVGGLADVAASALLLAESPPAGVHVTVGVRENALTVTAAVLPVALVLTDLLLGLLAIVVVLGWPAHIVDHLTDAVLHVLKPLARVDVAVLAVAVGATALTDSVQKVTIVNIAVRVVSDSLAGVTTGHRLGLAVFSLESVFSAVVFVCHNKI